MDQVNLWYFDEPYTSLCLGSLVTIWTTHISSTLSSVALDALQIQPAAILTSIFPERDSGCYIQIHQSNDRRHLHRLPLNYGHSHGLEGLLLLRNFVEGAGAEIAEAKILVYVTAIGRPTTCLPYRADILIEADNFQTHHPIPSRRVRRRSSTLVSQMLKTPIQKQSCPCSRHI